MKTYDVTYLKNGFFHSNLVETERDIEGVKAWFKENREDREVVGITEATTDSVKPGKPIISI